MSCLADDLALRYVEAMRDYLLRGTEAELQQAYELGRVALAAGMGVLDMCAVHYSAFASIDKELSLKRSPGSGKARDRTAMTEHIRRAGEFLTESMSPFEMTHRAFGEANAALNHLNRMLEEEAKRIAHVLHDEAGQLLAVVHIRLDDIGRTTPAVRQGIDDIRELLHQIESKLRRLSHEWRPAILEERGLIPALAFLADGVAKRAKLHVTLDGFKGERLSAPLETALYRIVQEALNNVTRHARASRVWIRLRRSEDSVECSIRDNGIGFDSARVLTGGNGGGLGLVGMRERLSALGGTLRIESAPSRGSEIRIRAPIHEHLCNFK